MRFEGFLPLKYVSGEFGVPNVILGSTYFTKKFYYYLKAQNSSLKYKNSLEILKICSHLLN